MTNQIDPRDRPDERSARGQDADARRGNARVRWAMFYREFIEQNTCATAAEARAAFDAQEAAR